MHLSLGNPNFFVSLLDSNSGCSMMKFIFWHSETSQAVIELIRALESLFNSKVGSLTSIDRKLMKWLCSDKGCGYVGHQFQNWLKQRGIVHEVTTAYSPKTNGCVERLNCTLLDIARTMLVNCKLSPESSWAKAVNTFCFIRNRLPTKSCKADCTSYEVIHGRKPDLGFPITFGSKAFVHIPIQTRSGKLQSRANAKSLIGYAKDVHCISLKEGKTTIEA